MEPLEVIFILLDTILLTYFSFTAIYIMLFAVASLFYKEKDKKNLSSTNKYNVTVLIPAYKEDSVIIDTAGRAMSHISKLTSFNVLVIADSLQNKTISTIKETGADVLPVVLNKSTKAKSINIALKTISNKTDYVIVLDADNIMAEGFIDNIICKLEQGYAVVQGHRTAKNSNTNIAILDGLSESVNNAIFREGHRVLGLSASLIGSGFVCEYNLFNELMNGANAVGGFDKELELMLLERKVKIGYAKNAIVYDEKIQQADAFVNQRRRWLSAQFLYFMHNITNGFRQLIKHANIDYFDKLIQFFIPPRIITLGLTFIFGFIHLLISLLVVESNSKIIAIVWFVLFSLSFCSILIVLPLKKLNTKTLKALLSIPKGFLLIMFALFKIKGANKSFIHTNHGINTK
ncbi:MAG: glycosyltransferase [Salinivirgaceae bacterium]|nr:glycosyltransferase [Salinivirgaceae bacterium]